MGALQAQLASVLIEKHEKVEAAIEQLRSILCRSNQLLRQATPVHCSTAANCASFLSFVWKVCTSQMGTAKKGTVEEDLEFYESAFETTRLLFVELDNWQSKVQDTSKDELSFP